MKNVLAAMIGVVASSLVGCGGVGESSHPINLASVGAGGAGGAGNLHQEDATRTPPPFPKAEESGDDLETKTGGIYCGIPGPGGLFDCFGYRPDYPNGGRECTGAPGPHEVNIYTGSGRSGWCSTLPATMGWWNLNSTNGWYNFFFVKDIEVGSAVSNGWVCYGPNATVGCYPLWAGYNFSYTSPTYADNQPGWQSIYVGP